MGFNLQESQNSASSWQELMLKHSLKPHVVTILIIRSVNFVLVDKMGSGLMSQTGLCLPPSQFQTGLFACWNRNPCPPTSDCWSSSDASCLCLSQPGLRSRPNIEHKLNGSGTFYKQSWGFPQRSLSKCKLLLNIAFLWLLFCALRLFNNKKLLLFFLSIATYFTGIWEFGIKCVTKKSFSRLCFNLWIKFFNASTTVFLTF